MTRPAVLATAVASALAVAAAPAAAQAAATGSSTLTLKGAAASSLAGAGVKVSAVAPATAKGKAITFPVATVSVGGTAALGHSGAIRFKKGARTLTLKAPALKLAASGSKLTAKIGGKTTTLLTVDAAKRSLNAANGTVALKGGAVKLTAAGAAAIKKALKLRALRSGTLGTLTVDATKGGTGTGGTGTGGTGSTGSGSTGSGSTGSGSTGSGSTGSGSTGTGGPTTDPKTCAVGAIATPSGGPAPLTAPAGAQTVTASSITWHVRDSFINYINTGEGTAVGNGATADPPSGNPALVYQFHFPFKEGWYDPITGKTRLVYTGSVVFCYFDHGIKLTAANPEIEIDPIAGTRRAVFTTGNIDSPDKRGILVNLDPVTRTDNGNDHTWTQMPGKIPQNTGDSTFAGYYAAGDPFGWITTTATAQ